MIIGSQQWQSVWGADALHRPSCDLLSDPPSSVCTCGTWRRLLRDRARALRWNPEIWRVNDKLQRDSLDDEMVSYLEVRVAVAMLRRTLEFPYLVFMHVDLDRPFAPVGVAGIPNECLRSYRKRLVAERYHLSQYRLDRLLQEAEDFLVQFVLEHPFDRSSPVPTPLNPPAP